MYEIPQEFIREQRIKNPNIEDMLRQEPIAGFGWTVPYPKQASIIREWMLRQPKVMLLTGWKRTSKTSLAAFIGTCFLLGGLNPRWPSARVMGINQEFKWPDPFNGERRMWICGKTLQHVEDVLLRIYRDLLPPASIAKWVTRNEHKIIIKQTNGKNRSAIIRTYDQDLESWKSDSADFVHLDEEPPLENLNEVLDRCRTTRGKIIISVAVDDADVSYLPEACMNPEKFFGTADFMHVKLGIEDVPDTIICPEEKENVYRKYDGTVLEKAVHFGDFAFLSGKWWPEFDSKVHVIPPFPIPDHWRKFRAIDAGVAAPTACLWAALDQENNTVYIYREYYKAGTTISQRCADIIRESGNTTVPDGDILIERPGTQGEDYELTMLDYHEFKRDSISGNSIDYEYVRNGLSVQSSTTLSQEARRDLARKWLFVDMLKKHKMTQQPGAPQMYIFNNCQNLVWEAAKKSFKKAKDGRGTVPERKVIHKDDHCMDCLEYIAAELSWIIENKQIE